jgi:alanyl-tRNA synthetase
MKTLKDIRSQFLGYFEGKGHEIVPSSPLVPHNDPTLLFTNAGMVQFKNLFTGAEHRSYTRAASSQKVVRAGGKHNDLDNVGYTARHHTFFEMLGNFSFGDYFKEEAIVYAWEFVTKDLGLPKDRLMATVHITDDEAAALWKKIAGFDDARVVRLDEDNFWAMGDTGPCGPCTEIFYDHGEGVPGGPPGSPDEDGDRFVEFWNLVFMQYEQVNAETRHDLPKPSVDTGMGLERISTILQGVHNNYDIDLFRTLIAASENLTDVKAEGEAKFSHRVIADHLRASSFLLADGVMPSNEGRGYVLRRIMRRAMRHAHILGAKDPLMYRLFPTLLGEMGAAYPELGRAEALIKETLKLEEERFRQTLSRGIKLLEDEITDLGEGDTLSGDVAFKLYDTYGFPLDLTEDALKARGISVDHDGFNTAMEAQRAAARANWVGSGEAATEAVWFDIRERVGPTEFVGYTGTRAEAKVTALIKDGQEVDALAKGEEGFVILSQTPFYGESGGQVGDMGMVTGPNGLTVVVSDTQKQLGDMHVHKVKVAEGELRRDAIVEAAIDDARREAIRSNHSATHLMHAALRNVLGDHVTQKGSLVDGNRLRFDFSHNRAVSADEVAEIEREVNLAIQQNAEVQTKLMSPEDAIEAGALALFGEKYGDEVRVLTMGHGLTDSHKPYSVELCGGTHVTRTGDIALFKIIGEGAVSAGVRRIEAVTREGARQYLLEQEARLLEVAEALKSAPADVPARVAQMAADRRRLEKELSETKRQLALGGGGASAPGGEAKEIGGVRVIARTLDGIAAKDLRGLVDGAKKQLGSGIVAFVGVNDGKAALAVGVTDDLKDRISAVDLVRVGAAAMGGKGGGGRPDMAQAGGPDGDKADDALAAITASVSELAGAA